MRPLGSTQLAVLKTMRWHGDRWHSQCGWVWSGVGGTIKIMESLVRRGLVVKTQEIMRLNNRDVTRDVYRLPETKP